MLKSIRRSIAVAPATPADGIKAAVIAVKEKDPSPKDNRAPTPTIIIGPVAIHPAADSTAIADSAISDDHLPHSEATLPLAGSNELTLECDERSVGLSVEFSKCQRLINELNGLTKIPLRYKLQLEKIIEHLRILPDAIFRFRSETGNETLLDACLDAYDNAVKSPEVQALFLQLFSICLSKIPKTADIDINYSAKKISLKRNLLYIEDEFGQNTMMKAIATKNTDVLILFIEHYKDINYLNPISEHNLFSYTFALLEASTSDYASASIPKLVVSLMRHGFIFDLPRLLTTLETTPLHPYKDSALNNLISAIDIFYETRAKPRPAAYAQIREAISKNTNLDAAQKEQLYDYLQRKHSPAPFFCCYAAAAPSPHEAELAILFE